MSKYRFCMISDQVYKLNMAHTNKSHKDLKGKQLLESYGTHLMEILVLPKFHDIHISTGRHKKVFSLLFTEKICEIDFFFFHLTNFWHGLLNYFEMRQKLP